MVENSLQYILNKYNISGKNPIIIPGMGRRGLYSLFAELEYKLGCEVGVYRGKNAQVMFHQIPNLMLYLVDAYKKHPFSNDVVDKDNLIDAENRAHKRLKNKNVEFIKDYSQSAVSQFRKEMLDFVYIDADHSYDFVMLDLIMWHRKVRTGGIVSGHDYSYLKGGHRIFDVALAVNNFVEAHNISHLFITDKTILHKEKGDTYPSWFYIK